MEGSRAGGVLRLLTTYGRPGGPFSVLRQNSDEPTTQVCQEWTLLLWPAERDRRSKVLGSDDSLSLSTRIAPLFTRTVEAMAHGPEAELTSSFSYANFVRESAWVGGGRG